MLSKQRSLIWGMLFVGIMAAQPADAQSDCGSLRFEYGPYYLFDRGSGGKLSSTYSGLGTYSGVGADGLSRFYYPWGEISTTTTSRKLKGWMAANDKLTPPFFNGHAGVCNTSTTSGPVKTTGSTFIPCATCGNPAAYGWQTMTISKRNLNVEPMKNPILVIQGFDPDFGSTDATTFETMVGYLNKVYPTTGESAPLSGWDSKTALKQLLDRDHDLVFIKFQSPHEDMPTQGKNLLEAMKWVASKSNAGSSIYIIGPSMGGQIARWALVHLYDARAAKDPTVNKLRVSGALMFDSPNLGAVIPASAVFASDNHAFADGTAWVNSINLSSTAAKQMLIQHRSGNNWVYSSTAQAHYASINSAANIRKMTQDGTIDVVAVSNGSSTGRTFGIPDNFEYFNGEVSKYMEYGFSLFTLSGTGGMYLSLRTGTRSASNTTFKWDAIVRGDTYASGIGYGGSNLDLENAPGGYRSTFGQLSATFAKTYNTKPNPIKDPNLKNHSFIPTVSALGLISRDLKTSQGLLSPVSIVSQVPQELSIFKRVFAPSYNQPHVSLNSENMPWILNEINIANAKAGSTVFIR